MVKKKVLIFGGKSAEHDISIITGLQTFFNLQKNGVDCQLIYIDSNNDWYLGCGLEKFDTYKDFDKSKFKKVQLLCGTSILYVSKNGKLRPLFEIEFLFNCCHGGVGENGKLNALFELCKITNSTTDSTSLGICMDKLFSKFIFSANNYPIVDFYYFTKNDWIERRDIMYLQINNFGFPVVIKPSRQGSSIGIGLAKNYKDFEYYVNIALQYDTKLLIERAIIDKTEFNCSVINTGRDVFASEIEEPNNSNIIYSFDDKYLCNNKNTKTKLPSFGKLSTLGMGGAKRKLPANIPSKLRSYIQNLSKSVYKLLDLNGVVRIDYIYDKSIKKLYINEINAIPGSLSDYFWSNIDLFTCIEKSSQNYWNSIFCHKIYESKIFKNL